jgi:large subunit ribosomal protein L4
MAETKKATKKKEEKVILNSSVWELPYNEDLIAQVLYVYSSNERKGSAKQKSRAEVAGGGRKPWKQKGTGRARHASIRSPLWVGGGKSFASIGRNFKKSINKKMAKKATAIMLSERLRNKELDFAKITLAQGKKLRKEGKKSTLIVTENNDVVLALRNLNSIKTVAPEKLNAKHLVSSRNIIVDEKSLKILEDRLTNEK